MCAQRACRCDVCAACVQCVVCVHSVCAVCDECTACVVRVPPWACRLPWPLTRAPVPWWLTERGEERLEVPQEGLQDHRQKEDSFEAPGERLHLKIQNASGCHSGTYRCTVEGLHGQRNQSGTVTLKVTGCPKERKEETVQKYRAEIVLLLALVVFYLTLIIFTCKFARQQSIFPDFSKPVMERAFLPVTSPHKHLEPVTLQKTELV
uniref:CD83 molecule n=1 Tax=Ursus maritimus TaxID=29073 RepID=A0A452UTJ4_URSMA